MATSAIAREGDAGEAATADAAAPWADRLLLFLLGISVVGLLSQITLGGVVRVTGSGDGCPDWPQCFGSWIPPWEYHAIIEWSHRTTGTFVGIIMLLALIRVVQRYRGHRALLGLALSGMVLVSIVGGIGGSVVLTDLNPAIRTLHLGLAEIVLLIMLVALVVAAVPPSWRSFNPLSAVDAGMVTKLAVVAAAVSLIALLSGAYAVWRDAGAVCGSWPLCGGSVIPEVNLTWIHMIHRLLAGIGAVVAAYAAFRAYRLDGAGPALKGAAWAVLGIITVQVLIGAANPWTGFDTWVKATHLSLATFMWGATALLAVLIWLPYYRSGRSGRSRILTPQTHMQPPMQPAMQPDPGPEEMSRESAAADE
ncbi:MAG: heme A synthase [Chloroflexi bacterium]|nr:heme A synthase [Chloroflexota bacterium]